MTDLHLRRAQRLLPACLATCMTRTNGEMKFDGQGYLLTFVLPNLYFHSSITYALLREAGVPLGKADFLGAR